MRTALLKDAHPLTSRIDRIKGQMFVCLIIHSLLQAQTTSHRYTVTMSSKIQSMRGAFSRVSKKSTRKQSSNAKLYSLLQKAKNALQDSNINGRLSKNPGWSIVVSPHRVFMKRLTKRRPLFARNKNMKRLLRVPAVPSSAEMQYDEVFTLHFLPLLERPTPFFGLLGSFSNFFFF